VRPGLRADLLLVDANPLQDVAAAHRRGVVLRGRWIPASELAAAMESVRKERDSAASGSR